MGTLTLLSSPQSGLPALHLVRQMCPWSPEWLPHNQKGWSVGKDKWHSMNFCVVLTTNNPIQGITLDTVKIPGTHTYFKLDDGLNIYDTLFQHFRIYYNSSDG
eukprot:scaffold656398_cov140-Prasinocladus_malaysianus.AAC.1